MFKNVAKTLSQVFTANDLGGNNRREDRRSVSANNIFWQQNGSHNQHQPFSSRR